MWSESFQTVFLSYSDGLLQEEKKKKKNQRYQHANKTTNNMGSVSAGYT